QRDGGAAHDSPRWWDSGFCVYCIFRGTIFSRGSLIVIIRTSCAVVIVALMANLALAQSTAPASQPATRPVRDPTEPGPQLRQALQPPATMPEAVARAPRIMPQVVRRGFIEVAGQP